MLSAPVQHPGVLGSLRRVSTRACSVPALSGVLVVPSWVVVPISLGRLLAGQRAQRHRVIATTAIALRFGYPLFGRIVPDFVPRLPGGATNMEISPEVQVRLPPLPKPLVASRQVAFFLGIHVVRVLFKTMGAVAPIVDDKRHLFGFLSFEKSCVGAARQEFRFHICCFHLRLFIRGKKLPSRSLAPRVATFSFWRLGSVDCR